MILRDKEIGQYMINKSFPIRISKIQVLIAYGYILETSSVEAFLKTYKDGFHNQVYFRYLISCYVFLESLETTNTCATFV